MKTALEAAKEVKLEWFAVYFEPSWFSIPLRGLKMRRFNIYSFYELGAVIAPLRLVALLDKDLAREVFYTARRHLTSLCGEKRFASLGLASTPMIEIEVDIDLALKELDKRGGVAEEDANRLSKSVTAFEEVLKAALPSEYTYVIDQLRGYAMPILVDGADQNFSENVLRRIGEDVRKDIKEAGRCLAFELPTAAGIHMMRAFEKVLRQLYQLKTGRDPGHRDIYWLMDELKKLPDADPKMLSVLDQIRNLHRNPLAHEVFLDIEEAVDLFHIAESAITAMARQL